MKYVSYEKLQPGMCVARPIYSNDGRVLLNSGVILNENYIARIIEKGIPGVFVVTDPDEMVDIPEVVSQQSRQEAVRQVKNVFESIEVGKTFDVAPLSKTINALIDEIVSNSNILIHLTDIRTYDGYTFSHSVNVCILSIIIGLKFQLNELELRELAIGAVLHDVGKTSVPMQILQKKGPLSPSEFSLVQKHTVNGWQILKSHPAIPLFSAHIAYQHHEQPNGKGYPRKLIDEQIDLYAKIVSVADAYDAMTSARVYRPAMLPSQALRVIRQLRDIQFNNEVANHLINSVALYPVGSRVQLTSLEIGIVVDVNTAERDRPIVRVLFQADGRKYRNPYEVDLAKERSLGIIRTLP